eukprot:COSAG01_NODE_2791_length_7069_cov_11.407174_2_plen_85_part_00
MYVMKKVFKTKAVQAALAKYPKLTQDGACAIYLFTCESPLYRQLNQKLRQRDRTALKVSQIVSLLLALRAGTFRPPPTGDLFWG